MKNLKGYSSLQHFESDLRIKFHREGYSDQLVADNFTRYLRKINDIRKRIMQTVTGDEVQHTSSVNSKVVLEFLATMKRLNTEVLSKGHQALLLKQMIALVKSERFKKHLNHTCFQAEGDLDGDQEISGVFTVSPNMTVNGAVSASGIINAAQVFQQVPHQDKEQKQFQSALHFQVSVERLLNESRGTIDWKEASDFIMRFCELIFEARKKKRNFPMPSSVITLLTLSWQCFNDPAKEERTNMDDISPKIRAALVDSNKQGILEQLKAFIRPS